MTAPADCSAFWGGLAIGLSSTASGFGMSISFQLEISSKPHTKNLTLPLPVLFTYNADGNRQTVADARGTTNYQYEPVRGRLLAKSDPTSGWSLEYRWDPAGRMTRIGIGAPGGTSVFKTDYTYDAAGRMETVSDFAGRVYTLAHDAAGNLALLKRPNAVDTKWSHDSRNRLGQVRTFRSSDSTTLASYAYGMSPASQRTTIQEADGTKREYSYDASSRLTQENITGGSGPTYNKTFAYDPVSNRTSQLSVGHGAATVNYQYDSRQRLTTENGAGYAWDANGNQLTNAAGDTFEWDYDDRLVRVVKADGTTVQNVYDMDGVLVRTTVTPQNGTPATTEYVVDASGTLSHVVAEVSGSTLNTSYVRAGDMLLAQLEGVAGANPRYFEIEGIGSVRSLLNESGGTTDTWRYTAFGEGLTRTGTSVQPYQFAGERFAASVGLYQNRARWLDVGGGRFVSIDPERGRMRRPITMVPYLYGEADPVQQIDPSGRMSGWGVAGITAGALVGTYVLTGVVLSFTNVHMKRNEANSCPSHPPNPEKQTCDGRQWDQDPEFYSGKWRNSDGSECFWDAQGNLKDETSYNHVHYSYVKEAWRVDRFLAHGLVDWIPSKVRDHQGGLTKVVECPYTD
jgi:RHS repeat-associated protein